MYVVTCALYSNRGLHSITIDNIIYGITNNNNNNNTVRRLSRDSVAVKFSRAAQA